MLERWIERLPKEHQRRFVANMRHKATGSEKEEKQFNGAFLELFLHEFLHGTGGEVVVEPKFDERTPDFVVTEELADGSQLSYVVEATDINLERGSKIKRDQNELTVLDWLDEICSPDFRLFIRMEGKLESLPRKGHLKRTFEKFLEEADYEAILQIAQEHQSYDFESLPGTSFAHGSWTVTGHLLPVPPETREENSSVVGIVSLGTAVVDDIGKIKERLYDKAKPYKHVENLIIALGCEHSSNRLEEVLFGSKQVTIYYHNDPTDTTPLPEAQDSQKPNGFWFNSGGPINTNVIGVVVFYGIYPWSLGNEKAVFFANPYEERPMPNWSKAITHAEYSNGEISIVEGVPPSEFLSDYEVIGFPFEKPHTENALDGDSVE